MYRYDEFDQNFVNARVAEFKDQVERRLKGEITEEQAAVHPQSNILMGCLGTDNDPPVDLHFIPKLRSGDTLMACSDGVWHYFNAAELGSVLSSLSAREASEFLIEKARSRGHGGGDNLSLVIVKLEPLGGP